MNYLNSLSGADREELLEFMRTIDQEAEKFLDEHKRAAHFDPWLKAAVTWEYLSCLRIGLGPEEAKVGAMFYGCQCVRIHNSRRPKDANWQRWEDSAAWWADNIYERTPKPCPK